MKIMAVPGTDHYQYLKHIFEKHVRSGIPSEELRLAAELHEIILSAQDVDLKDGNLGNAEITSIGPNGVALNLLPERHSPPPIPDGKGIRKGAA